MAYDYETLPCGLLTFGDDGRIVSVNATLYTLLGYQSAAGLTGQHVQVLFSPGGRVFYQTHLFPLLKLQGEVEEIYLSLQTARGEEAPFLLNGRRRERAHGFEIECVLMRMRQRTHFESELLQAKKAAQKASKAKDEFLAALSHELRTPLSPVLMVAASMELDPAMPAEAREQAGVIRRNAELEARLIDDLLDHTRITHGKMHLVLAPVDMHTLLRHTAEIVRSDASGKQVAITFHYQAHSFHVQGDSARLQQVFWNVTKNAVKFTPTGGQVRITTADDEDGRLIIRVRDTGIGIAPENLARIFNPFEQGNVSKKFGGLGLGLAITRGLVERHGGSICAESEGLGHGSTIVVALPTIPAPANALGPASGISPALGRKLRLLLVEDHDSTREVLGRILQKGGHDVHSAANGAEALALAASAGPFDVLVSDLGLPDQSGYDVLKGVRNVQPGIVALALSGYGMEEDVQRAKAAGFFAHLVKPVPIDQLRALLDRIAAGDGIPAGAGLTLQAIVS